MLCCPGSSQGSVTFCCNWEGAWLGPGCYSVPPYIIAGGRGELGSEREQCGLESLTEGIEVDNTIPKSQVMFITRLGGMQIPLLYLMGCAPQSHDTQVHTSLWSTSRLCPAK